MGNMKKWFKNNEIFNEQLLIWCDGLQNRINVTNITFILFPFLFSPGHGAYDG
jgi:hypothetical protein